MLRFLAICWRDLWRNRRRTILTGLVMAFSVAVMILFVGLGDGGHLQMIKSATDAYLGHAQIQHQAFQDEPDLRHVIEASDLGRLGPLLDGDPEVLGWAPRVNTGGLLSKKVPDPPEPDPDAPEDLDAWRDMASEGAFVVGVDPLREAGVSTLGGSVVADDPAAAACAAVARRGPRSTPTGRPAPRCASRTRGASRARPAGSSALRPVLKPARPTTSSATRRTAASASSTTASRRASWPRRIPAPRSPGAARSCWAPGWRSSWTWASATGSRS